MKQDGTLFTLENEELLVTVDRRGAELTGIYDKRAGRDVLWGGDPSVWSYRSPVLFPFVGKCYEGTYLHNGTEYEMTPHGFARNMDFRPVLCDVDECWFQLKDTDETFRIYPFHFQLEIGHRLEGRRIHVMWKVTNPDSGDLLFMMGGHPAFAVPEGRSIYDYTFAFDRERDHLHYLAPNEKGYEESALQGTLQLADGQVPLTRGFFHTALTYIFDRSQVERVSLLLDGRPYVTVDCQDFPYLGVWTMEETHPFVCLEPWEGLCASDGFAGELKDRPGIVSLGSLKSWDKSYTIELG